jgi:hypothetical protein
MRPAYRRIPIQEALDSPKLFEEHTVWASTINGLREVLRIRTNRFGGWDLICSDQIYPTDLRCGLYINDD